MEIMELLMLKPKDMNKPSVSSANCQVVLISAVGDINDGPSKNLVKMRKLYVENVQRD
jgi:hypothetical protein